MLYVIVTQITNHDESIKMPQSQVTQSQGIEKNIEDFGIDNIIQYDNSMLATFLWSVYGL